MNIVATIARKNGSLSSLVDSDHLERQADDMIGRRARIWRIIHFPCFSDDRAEAGLTELAEIDVSEPTIAPIHDRIDSGLDKADSKTIRQHVAFLLGSFAKSTAPDPAVYSRAMVEEVIAAGPNYLTLDSACKRLRRTLEWPPSVPKMLAQLEKENEIWWRRHDAVADLAELHERAVRLLSEKRKVIAQIEMDGVDLRERDRRLDDLDRRYRQTYAALIA